LRDGRLCSGPCAEIATLYAGTHDTPEFDGELFDI